MTKAATNDNPRPDRHLLGRWTPWILLLVIAGIAAGAVTVWRSSGRDREPAKLDQAFVYDVDRYRVIPEDQLGYREVAQFETDLLVATALTVGPEGRIVAAGDEKVLVFTPEGELTTTIRANDTVYAMTTSSRGELFIAAGNRVGRCSFAAPITWIATVPGSKARITSVAVDKNAVYVADAGARTVWRFGHDGSRAGRIGDRDPGRNVPGFSVPSPFFDLLVAPDGLLRIVDPGRHRITAFTPRGDLEFSWGKPSFELSGFSGCCNPSHLAMLPDGSFVTSEKGIPRVKVHDADGKFVTAVVGSDRLDSGKHPCDVATDPQGRIVLLDPGSRVIRVFAPREEGDREDG